MHRENNRLETSLAQVSQDTATQVLCLAGKPALTEMTIIGWSTDAYRLALRG